MFLHVYFDGSCGPTNPGGTAAYGFVIKDQHGEVMDQGSGLVCRGAGATNNVAEFEALYQAMFYVAQHHPKTKVEFHGDSSLVISLMEGESKARSGIYLPYYKKSVALAEPFIDRGLWRFQWVSRQFNREADELAQYQRFSE